MKTLLTYRKPLMVLVTIIFTLTFHSISHAQTYSHIYVDAVNGNNRTANGSGAKPYKTITFALAISERDRLPDPWHVHIRPGTYDANPTKPPSEREIFPFKLRDGVIFEGTTTAKACIIDAQHVGETQVPILSGIVPDPSGVDIAGVTIRNLTLQNMSGLGKPAGGIVLQDPTVQQETRHETPSSIEGCIIHNNGGGGVWSNTPIVLVGNTFSSNDGWGVNISKLIGASRNIFSDNGGGGFNVDGCTGDISENIVQNNEYRSHISVMEGNITHNTFEGHRHFGATGGALNIWTMTGNITHNTFNNNSNPSDSGGALGIFLRMTGNITHNIFYGNSAGDEGGALYIPAGNVEIINNIFFNNSTREELAGESVKTKCPTHFKNNLFIAWLSPDEATEDVGRGAAVWVSSPDCRFHNNIFVGLEIAIYTEGVFNLPITHNLFHNIKRDVVNAAGVGAGNDVSFYDLVTRNASDNLAGDPRLVNPAAQDFHLQATSPAIDAGTNEFAPPDDFDGVARPIGDTVDIGPYEYGGISVIVPPVVDGGELIIYDDPPSEPTPDPPAAAPIAKLYWGIRRNIQRADLDGSNIESLVNRTAVSLALDTENNKIYWAESDSGIFRANLEDGTNIERIIRGDVWNFSGGRIALDGAGGKMYWTNGVTRSIFRANLDGTQTEEIFTVFGRPLDIALDVAGGKMYWTQWEGEAGISRANLDGSGLELLVSPGDKRSIALDITGGKMYWTDGSRGIGMANLDGSNIRNFETPDFTTGGITLDLSNGTMYWIDAEGFEIRRGNLDGSQQRTIIEYPREGSGISDIALYAAAVQPEPPTPLSDSPVVTYPAWDVNEDGKTEIADLLLVVVAMGQTPPANPRTDVNGDGTVDLQDVTLVAQHLGKTTEPAAPANVVLPPGLTPQTVQQTLDILRTAGKDAYTVQDAVVLLEQLLASLIPNETGLLSNYPNPFNPETWIPYQLAKPADITFRIYAVDGTLVRQLALGHQLGGVYYDRSRAAYWDGKNTGGEPVASGVYFYTLTAGDFTATGKMLVRK